MTTLLRHTHFQPLNTNFADPQTAHAGILKSKISEIIPKKPVPRSILRSLCLEYNEDKSSNAHSSFRLPGVLNGFSKSVKLDCTPPNAYKSSSHNIAVENSPTSLQSSIPCQSLNFPERYQPLSNRLRLLLSSYVSRSDKITRPRSPIGVTSQECEAASPELRTTKQASRKRSFTSINDITPVLERYGQLSSNIRSSVESFQISESSQTENFAVSSPPSHCSTLSDDILSRLRRRSIKEDEAKSPENNNSIKLIKSSDQTNLLPTAAKHRSSEFLTSDSEYFQPDFANEHYMFPNLSSENLNLYIHPAQSSIEVPSWKEDDLLAKHIDSLGPASALRSRPHIPSSISRTLNHSNRPVSSPKQNIRKSSHMESFEFSRRSYFIENEEENTSDSVYESRHSKFEFMEIKREKLSRQRIDEDELKSKLEKRDLESWRRKHTKRVENSTEIDPEKKIPTQLAFPIQEARFVHVVYSIPVVAFGCRVPKPKFGPFRLKRFTSS